jgi:hypothetical protein
MALAVSELRFDLNLVMVRPASEKSLSEGAEVAGMHKVLLARLDISGIYLCLFLHQIKGFVITLSPATFFNDRN